MPEPSPNPLEELTLQRLQLRTSMKWRAHPADVLPMWVAEMDVMLAPTVAEALRTAIDIGDTGYPCGTALAEAVSQFASQRWQWHDLRGQPHRDRPGRHARCRRDATSGHRPR